MMKHARTIFSSCRRDRPQPVALNFASGGSRQFLDKLELTGTLVMSGLAPDKLPQFFLHFFGLHITVF